jgi:sulfur carrier protein ThiS
MNIVVLHFELKKVRLPEGSQASDVLLKLQYPTDTAVYVNDVRVPPDYILSDGDEVFLRAVSQGGIVGGAPLLGMEPLQEFASGAQDLVIIDPYILRPPKPHDGTSEEEAGAEYAERLAVVTCADTLARLHLIYMEGNRHTSPALKQACEREGCSLTMKRSEKIHDRIWIKDYAKALAAGTSLNGTNGQKLAFVLPLPKSDLEFVRQFMRDNDLMPPV